MSNPHKIEFEIGETVTYHPYEFSYPRVVIGIDPHQNIWGKPDDRVWYLLATLEAPDTLVSRCTGKCIEQSQYFKEYAPEVLYINYYWHCGEHWNITGDSMHNDRCPKCNTEITPLESEKIYGEDTRGDTV